MPMFRLDRRYFYRRHDARAAIRTAHQIAHDECLVGYVGRLVPEKGIPDLLHAVANTQRLRLLIVGDGPERIALQQLAQDIGLGTRCTFRWVCPMTRLQISLSALDILVLPSRTTKNWKEQFGRVLVEAMACEVSGCRVGFRSNP